MNLARIERAVDHENFENLNSWKGNDLFASDCTESKQVLTDNETKTYFIVVTEIHLILQNYYKNFSISLGVFVPNGNSLGTKISNEI